MKKAIVLIGLFLSIVYIAEAQRYPIPVLDNQKITITTDRGSKTIPVVNDTLWVFNGSQFKSALAKAKKLEHTEEQIKVYNMQLEIYKARDNEKDSLISLLKKDRDYYNNNWNTCTKDLEKQIRRCKRKSLYTKLAIAGIPVALVAGFFLAK
ncbi:MAG: hypothetical protein U9N85_13205 [Bacteroidota bacterium]|nr:hypothetical protein [Bacteroidota bacterium]